MRPIAQRTFQAPSRSADDHPVEIRATLPPGVSSQPRKPGTDSSMPPPTAGVCGPQQGGASGSGPFGEAFGNFVGAISGSVFISTSIVARPNQPFRTSTVAS